MSNFQHHPDGLVFIRTDQGTYMDTVINFRLDLLYVGMVYPDLTNGYIGRYYEPGVNHYVHTDDTAVPQGLNWLEGNAYIEACEQLIAAKADRELSKFEQMEIQD